MPYILSKTDGSVLATVQDASLDNTTNLVFVGRNYAGYGQAIEENLLKLLENFSNTSQPSRPVQGQLWFDKNSISQRLKVCYDGTNFRDVNNVLVGLTAPTSPNIGDIWWDTNVSQLKVYVSSGNWEASSPFGGASSSWSFEKISDGVTSGGWPAIEGKFGGGNVGVVFSNSPEYRPVNIVNSSTFPVIKRGITLPGADAISGSSSQSTSTGYLLWGTAAESITTKKLQVATTGSNASFYVPFGDGQNGARSFYTTSTFYFNPSTNILNVKASSAIYADIAERYAADAVYEPGTVLVIGGDKEVTISTTYADTRVAGIVSKNPAYMMNSEAGNDETHPYIALKGRVPCQVIGPIVKGDLLVTSAHPGYATVANGDCSGAIIGKALEDHSEGFGVIEVKV